MRRIVILLLCMLILPVNFLILSAQTPQNRKMNMADYEKRRKEYVLVTAGADGDHESEQYNITDAFLVYNNLGNE